MSDAAIWSGQKVRDSQTNLAKSELQTMTDHYNGYYADTAYDSTIPRNVPLPDPNKKTLRTRLNGDYNLVRPAQCREFLAKLSIEQEIRLLRGEEQYEDSKVALETVPEMGRHEVCYHVGIGPRTVVGGLKLMGGIGVLIGTFTAFLMLFGHNDTLAGGILHAIKVASPFILSCYAVYKFCDYLMRTGKVRNKITKEFHRRTGMLRYLQKGQWFELPFDEFDPCVRLRMNRAEVGCYIHLIHREGKAIFLLATETLPWQAWWQWELLQQYMDISRPLPDIPYYEKCRHLDPVTADYDIKWSRPKDFWYNMDMEVAEQMRKQSDKAAQSYPWGCTFEQALAHGWRPSPYSDKNLRNFYAYISAGYQFEIKKDSSATE